MWHAVAPHLQKCIVVERLAEALIFLALLVVLLPDVLLGAAVVQVDLPVPVWHRVADEVDVACQPRVRVECLGRCIRTWCEGRVQVGEFK